jgi:plastocyanin
MKRVTIAFLAVGLAATAFLVSAQASTPKLTGQVGPAFSITLKKGTTKVKTLKAGKYLFVISDKAGIHNFTIEREKGGPKIEKTLTGTTFMGKKTVAMTLKKGTWKYYCSVHESSMFGFFKVTS